MHPLLTMHPSHVLIYRGIEIKNLRKIMEKRR